MSCAFRMMTYNVHRCIGTDGRVVPERIAEVIEASNASLIALQEIDIGRRRTGRIDQARAIAKRLEMDVHFHPAWKLAEEQYGEAIISRFALKLVQAGPLPRPRNRLWRELRGALWVSVGINSSEVQ